MKTKTTNRKERAFNVISKHARLTGMLFLTLTLASSVALAQRNISGISENTPSEVTGSVEKNPITHTPVKNINYVAPSVPLCPSITSLNVIDHTHELAIIGWSNTANFDSISVRYVVTGGTNYRTVTISGTPNTGLLIINGLSPLTSYDFEISTICQNGTTSNWSSPVTITTFHEPAPRYGVNQRNTSYVKMNPNPATSYTTLTFNAPVNSTNSITITNTTGKIVYKTNVYCADGKMLIPIDLSNTPPGMYFVKVGNINGYTVERLIVQ